VQVILLAVATAWSQTGTSRVTGQVLDQGGGAVVRAKVTVTNESTGVEYESTTTEAGTYLLDALPPGSYTVRVELEGFKTFVSKNNVLTVGVPLTVNAKLEVGSVTTTVEVVGSYERVQTTTSGNLGGLIDRRTLTDLPLALDTANGGRNPLMFERLQPGVNVGANIGGGTHVNGARDRAFNFTLDGIDINETSAGGSDFSPLRPNPDSLEEFRVITSNPTAQYGRNSGAQVELVTRSGTNDIHGSVFYYHRNSALAANEWGNNLDRIPRPLLIQHQYGFSVGGPIIHNKTFFFFNYQGQRQLNPFTLTRTVYTKDARAGQFRYVSGCVNPVLGACATGDPNNTTKNSTSLVDSSGNLKSTVPVCSDTVPTNCIASFDSVANDPRGLGLDPTIRDQWIGLTALPNIFNTGDGLNTAGFIFSGGRLDPQRDFVVRIDHKFNDNNTIYGRYAWGEEDTVNDTTNAGAPRFPGLAPVVNTLRSPRNLALGYRRVISPTVVNELIGGGNHFTFNFIIPTAGQVLPFFLNNVTDPLLNDRGNLRTLNTYQVLDNLSWNRGAHAIRLGFNIRYQQHRDVRGSVAGLDSELEVTFNQLVTASCLSGSFGSGGKPGVGSTGTEFFCLPATSGPLAINSTDQSRLKSTVNDLLGRIGNLQRGFVASPDLQSYQQAGTPFLFDARYGEYDFYAQDTWRLKPNLTLDLGLRAELKAHPVNPENLIFHPNALVRAGAAPSNTLQWVQGPIYNNNYNNLSPSIGLAWDPFKSGKTSIRANYRLAYDRINTFVISSQIFNTVPGLTFAAINKSFGLNGGPGGTGGRWRDNPPAVAPPPGITPQSLTQPPVFGLGSIAVMDPAFHAPKTHMWDLDIQREVGKGIVVDFSYIGRHAINLIGAYDANQVEIFKNGFLDAFKTVQQGGGQSPLMNQLYGPVAKTGQTGSDFVRANFADSLTHNSVATIANDAANRTVSNSVSANCPPAPQPCPLLVAAGLSPFFFKAYPQFNGSMVVIDSNDFSSYHAFQAMVQRKFARNLTFQSSYTFSKSLDDRSFDPTFGVVRTGTFQSAGNSPFNINDRRRNKARSDFDRKHIFIAYAVWDLPFGGGQRFGSRAAPVLRHLIEGWQASGVLTWESGRPFTVYSGFNTLTQVVSSPAQCTGCPKDLGAVRMNDTSFSHPPGPTFFDAAEIAKFSDPPAGAIGNTGRNYFTAPGYYNLDFSIAKRTYFQENRNLELRFDFFNLTNSVSFDIPVARINTKLFGWIGDSTISSSRKIRVSARINF